MNGSQILFLFLAAIAVAGALGVAFSEKPVRAAISLVMNIVVLALVYFTLGSQYLGITQIMVYAGAIMVLFLFVIMILTARGRDPQMAKAQGSPLAGVLAGVVFLSLMGAAVAAPAWTMTESGVPAAFAGEMGKPQPIATVLFSQYALPFEAASILLMIGVVGAILLAKRRLQ